MTKSFIFIISLDKKPAVYHAGDSITGSVKLYSQIDMKLRRLYLHFQGSITIPRRYSKLTGNDNKEHFLSEEKTIWGDGKIAMSKLF